MEFEFDQAKSEANRLKHGIDFVQAQELWKDLYALQIQAKSDTKTNTSNTVCLLKSSTSDVHGKNKMGTNKAAA